MNNVFHEEKSSKRIRCILYMGKPRKYLGVSQFAAVLDMSPYQSSVQVKQILELGDNEYRNFYTQFGIDKEAVAKYLYAKIKKVKVETAKFVTDVLCPRIGGIADGLIGNDGGVEIKCHLSEKNFCNEIPPHYLIQVVGYMFLYGRKWWDFMSCLFNNDKICKYRIIRVYWNDFRIIWFNEWYDKLVKFAESVRWNTTL